MGKNIEDHGKMESSMVLGFIKMLIMKSVKESGLKEKESVGYEIQIV
jgi:hypothetical protein